jgi:hypothetical protein
MTQIGKNTIRIIKSRRKSGGGGACSTNEGEEEGV